jgi:hypothetical protein
MAKTRQEGEADAREEQLEHIRDQISSVELVIRQMTDSERVHWDDCPPPLIAKRRPKSAHAGLLR